MENKNTTKKLNAVIRRIAILSIAALLFSLKGLAQTDTEFWFAAPEVDSTHADSSIMRFASINEADVTVSIPANPSFTPITFHMAANSSYMIDWNNIGGVNYKNAIENTAYDRAVNKGIHVVATDKIEAYYEVKTLPNSEVFALKGANALGKTFFVNFQNYWYNKYPLLCDGKNGADVNDSLPLPFANNDFQDQVAENSWSAFDIVATEDGTTSIKITPTNPIISTSSTFSPDGFGFVTAGSPLHLKGIPYVVTLTKGQTYSGRQAYKTPIRSLGGTKIESDKNIAITCKEDGLIAWNHDDLSHPVWLNPTDTKQSNTAAGPLFDFNNYGIDLIGDQLIPTDLIGNEYVVMRGGVYPDDDLNTNQPPNEWDFDGERVFLTGTVKTTTYTVQAYNNAGSLINTYNNVTPNANGVATYNFKYRYNGNEDKANIEQFLRITSNDGSKFYTYHVSGLLSELGSAMIPTVTGCTGSTQLAFTRSYNGLFQVNLMVKQGAEGAFKIYDTKGVEPFTISASDFKAIPGSGWSVYVQPNNIWADPTAGINKVDIGQTYIIKNTQNVFHLGIINISEFNYLDTMRVPQYIGNWYGDTTSTGLYPEYSTWNGYSMDNQTIPTSVIATAWKQPGWKKTLLKTEKGSNYYALTNIADKKNLFVAHWISNNRGAFYGYFSDFNKFTPFAAVPDANHPKCLGDTIQLKAAGGVKYRWYQPANLKFIDDTTAQNPRVVPQVAGKYLLSVFIDGFCSDSVTYYFTFNVLAPPKPTITGSQNVCFGSGNQTYKVTLADTNGFASSVKTWTVVGGTIVSGQGTGSVVVDWTTKGAQSVSVSVDNQSCAAGSTNLPVTVSALPTVTISNPPAYCPGSVVLQNTFSSTPAGATYVWSSSNPAIGLTLPGGNTDYIPSFMAVNGTAAPLISVISVTPTLGCAGLPGTYTITVTPKDNAAFHYSASPFCQTGANPTPTITGLTGGTFSSTAGLVFVSTSTGQLNLANSTVGTYTITYTTNGTCPNTSTESITINQAPSGAFVYAGPYCKENSNPSPALNTGSISGVYSATPAGLVFVSTTTGQIDLANSSAGTYTVTNTIAASGGCAIATAIATVTINPTPTVIVPSVSSVCPGATVAPYTFTSLPAGAMFNWSSTNASVGLATTGGSTDQVPGFVATNTGTTAISTTISATPTLLGCAGATKVYTLTVNPKDNAAFTYSPNTFCQTGTNPSPVITGLSGGTFSSSPAGLSINPGTGLITLSGSTLGTYNVIYTTKGICPNTSTVSVTITTAPSAAFAYAGPYCKNDPNPNPTYNSGASAGAFSATPSGLVFVSTSTGQIDLKNSTPGTYTVTNTIPAASGCAAATALATVTINTPITVKVPTPSPVCPGSVIPENTFTSTPAGASFVWSNSNTSVGLSSTGAPTALVPAFTATNTTTGSIYATIFVTPTISGCVGTPNSYTITVTPKDNAAFNYSASNYCQTGTNPTPTITGLTGGTFSSTAGLAFASTATGEINAAASTVGGPYTVTYTTNGVCPNKATASVTITAGPSAAFAYAGPYCKENSNPLPIYNSGAYAGVFSATPAGLVFVSTATGQVDLAASAVGKYTVTNTIAAANGCGIATASNTITIKPTPTVSVPAIDSKCPGNSVPQYTFTSNVPGTISWINSNTLIGLEAAGTDNIPLFTATNTSNVPIKGTITVTPPSNGCTVSTNTFSITVNPAPKVTDQTVKVCELTKKAITVHSTGGTKPLTEGLWTIIAGSSVTYGAADSVLTVTANAGAGTSRFRYVLPDNNGCTDTAIVMVINSLNPSVTLPAAAVCQNMPLTLVATIGGLNDPKSVWSSNPVSPAIIPANQINNTTVTAVTSEAGNFIVQVTVTDSIGCIGTTGDVGVSIYPKPVASVSPATNAHICQNAPLTLNGQPYPNVVTYKWEGDVASISPNAQVTTFKSSVLGNHDFRFIVISDHTCSDTIPYRVIVDENPISTLGKDIEVCAGISTKITVNPTGGSGSYIYDWRDDNGAFNLPHDNAPTYVKSTPGSYNVYLKVTDSISGCHSADTMIVTINQNPVVSQITGLICAGLPFVITEKPSGGSGVWKTHEWWAATPAEYALLIDNQTTSMPTFISILPGPHYFHYKVTDSKGCIGENDATIKVNNLPKPVITGKPLLQVCANVALPITVAYSGTATYQWSGTGANFLSPSTAQNPKFTATAAGTYTLTVTITDENSCSGTDAIAVKVNSLPTPVVKNDFLCAGDTKQLKGDAGFSSQKWMGDVSLIPVAERTSSNPTFATTTTTTAKTYNLEYSVVDANGCSDTIPVLVTVNPLPSVDAGLDHYFSHGDVLTLTGQPTGSQYAYTWTPKDSIAGANTTRIVTTVPLHSTFNFTLSVQDLITQCKASDIVKVIDTTGALDVSIDATPSEICIGDTSHVDVKVTGGKKPYSYTWSPAVEVQYADGSVRVRPITTTLYTVTVTDQNKAVQYASTTVTVNQLPTVILKDTSLCANDTIQIKPTVKTQTGSTVSTTLWTGGGTAGLHGVTTIPDVYFYNSISGSYPLTFAVTDTKGCKNTASMNVTINILPVVAIQGDKTEICAGSSVALSVSQTKGASISTYGWSDTPSGHLTSATGSTNSYSSTASGDVNLSVVDANGCKASANYHVTVNQNPAALIQDLSVCQNVLLTLDGKPGGGSGTYTSHLWTGTDVAKVSPKNIQNPTFSTSVSGTYSVNYAVTDSKTCTGNKTIQIVVNPLPSVTYNPQLLEVCAGSPLTITSDPQPIASDTTYQWIESGKPLHGNSKSVIFKSNVAGVQKIMYQVETDKGCKLLDTLSITVKPKPTITINPDKTIVCENELDNLGSTYAGGTMSPKTFTWSTTPSTPDLLTSFDKQTTVFKEAVFGSTVVSLVYVDQNNCSDTDNVTIHVNPNPNVTFTDRYIHACQRQNLKMEVNPTHLSNRTYTWTGGTGIAYLSDTTVSNPVFMTTATGKYTLYYTISETNYGCEVKDSVIITVTETPVKVTETEKVCQGSTLQLNVGAMGATGYLWSGPNTSLLSSSSSANPTISTVNNGIFTYTVTGTLGALPNTCSEISTVKVFVFAKPTITGVPLKDSAYYKQPYQFNPTVTPTNATYLWTPSTGFNDASVKNAQTVPLTADLTNITFLVTETMSGLGCNASVPSTIYVRTRMIPGFNPDPECVGNSVKLTGTVTGGSPDKTYTWTTSDGIVHKGTSFTYSASDTNIVSLTVMDKYDTVTISKQNIVYPLPSTIDTTYTTCAGYNVKIKVPGSSSDTYNWTGTGSQKLTSKGSQSTQFQTGVDESTQLYHLYAQTKNAYGCTDTSTVNIQVNENPKINVQDTVHVIIGQPTTISVGTSDKYTYEWTPADLFVDPTSGTVTTKTVTTDTKVYVKVIDKITGCSKIDTIIIKADPPITVAIDPVSVCSGGLISITARVAHNKTIPTFTWTTGTGILIQKTTSYTLNYIPTATTTLTVSVTDGYSSAIDVKTITVYPVPTVSIHPDISAYFIGQTDRNLFATVNGGTGTSLYSWYTTNGASVTPKDADKTTFSATLPNNYIVGVVVTDTHQCRDTAEITPTVLYPPKWPTLFCQGNSYEFSINSPVNLEWVINMNGVTTTLVGTKTDVNMDSIGRGSISLYDLNDLGNPIFTSTFIVNTKPYVDFYYTPDTGISIGENVKFINLSILDKNNQRIPNNLEFFWDFVGDQIYTSEETNPIYNYDETAVYHVTLIGLDTITQCRDTVVKKLQVTPNPICGLKFPNAFTPEALKDNHFLPGYIVGIKDSGYDLRIFNRWGQLLWETTSKTGSWDGVYNDALCKQDVYVYHCKAECENGKEIFVNGDVTLIK